MQHFLGDMSWAGNSIPLVVVTLAMLIPIVAIVTEYFQKKEKMRLMEKAIEHGESLENLKLEPNLESLINGSSDRPKMPYRDGMVVFGVGAGLIISAYYVDLGVGVLESLMIIGGAVCVGVGVALLFNDYMNRDRFKQG